MCPGVLHLSPGPATGAGEAAHWVRKRCQLSPAPTLVLPSAGVCPGSPRAGFGPEQSSLCQHVWASAGSLKESCCSTKAPLDGDGVDGLCALHDLSSNCTKFMCISDWGGEILNHFPLSRVLESQETSSLHEENNFRSPSSWSHRLLCGCIFQLLPLPSFSTPFGCLCLATVPKTLSSTLS